MKVKVLKAYKDKHDKSLHKPGEELTISKGRYEEINSTARGIFVEEIKSQQQTNKKK